MIFSNGREGAQNNMGDFQIVLFHATQVGQQPVGRAGQSQTRGHGGG